MAQFCGRVFEAKEQARSIKYAIQGLGFKVHRAGMNRSSENRLSDSSEKVKRVRWAFKIENWENRDLERPARLNLAGEVDGALMACVISSTNEGEIDWKLWLPHRSI
jgi:hypothetical protein